jgi:hypothetical protein
MTNRVLGTLMYPESSRVKSEGCTTPGVIRVLLAAPVATPTKILVWFKSYRFPAI